MNCVCHDPVFNMLTAIQNALGFGRELLVRCRADLRFRSQSSRQRPIIVIGNLHQLSTTCRPYTGAIDVVVESRRCRERAFHLYEHCVETDGILRQDDCLNSQLCQRRIHR